MRVGIIGGGGISETHARAVQAVGGLTTEAVPGANSAPHAALAAHDGGGALMNQAIHTVDLLLWLFGPVARVYARTATLVHQIEVEDTAVATLEFASGALGSIEATTSVYPGFSRRVEVTGSEGTIVI